MTDRLDSTPNLLCPDCGHHIHQPETCQWTFGAGRFQQPCQCHHWDCRIPQGRTCLRYGEGGNCVCWCHDPVRADSPNPGHDCLMPSACGTTGFYCANYRPIPEGAEPRTATGRRLLEREDDPELIAAFRKVILAIEREAALPEPRHERAYIPLIDNRLRCRACEELWPCEAALPEPPLDVERLGLSDEQTRNLRQHLIARQQTLGEWISDVLFDMRMGRPDGIDYPPAARLRGTGGAPADKCPVPGCDELPEDHRHIGPIEELLEKARLVSQWHGAMNSGPLEALDAELGELREVVNRVVYAGGAPES